MDSRAIVSVLSELRVTTRAFNYSPSGSQDLEFAKKYAETEDNIIFHSYPCDDDGGYNFRCELANILSQSIMHEGEKIERPKSVWSGDGGSVSVGCVYLNEEIMKAAGSGSFELAISRYFHLNNIKLPLNIFRKQSKYCHADLLMDYVINEIDSINCNDKQKLYLFLLLNDQRRHLHDFYENLDIHGLEYQLPFFDSKFLEYVASIPIDCKINHKFYTEWFKCFPHSVLEAPWQTYRGHVACPVASDNNYASSAKFVGTFRLG